MQKSIAQRVHDYIKEHLRNKRWRQVVTMMACIVVFCTTYALILPGITMSAETYCGKEEHTHTQEECYERVLICGYDDGTAAATAAPAHTHTDACYQTQSVLICTLPEGVAHTHSQACYTLSCGQEESAGHTHTQECYGKILVCGQEESAGHTHSQDCYDENGNLICGQEESAGHTHSDACYTTSQTPTCGQEESAGHTHSEACYTLTCTIDTTQPHTHGDGCYKEEKTLICTESTETPATAAPSTQVGHVHTDACYESTLTCTKEEHTHELICYSNPNADVESAAVWERTVPQELDGDWAENLIAVAKSQLGYTESTANYTVLDDGTTMKGYTRYGAWYGDQYGDWCAMYVSFCLNYAGIPREAVPYAAACPAWTEELTKLGLYHSAAEGDYTPVPGDIIFFSDDGVNASHVGIVYETDEEQIRVIEGNCANQVTVCTYTHNNPYIFGVMSLAEARERAEELGYVTAEETKTTEEEETTEEKETTEEEETTEEIRLEAEYGGTRVVLTAAPDALPEGVTDLRLVLSEPDEQAKQKIAEVVNEGETYFALDIKIMSGEEEIQPLKPVKVTFEVNDGSFTADNTQVYHIDESAATDGQAVESVTSAVDENGNVTIEAAGFSTYVVKSVNAVAVSNASEDESSIESINVGETKTLTVGAGETVKLKFVPEYTHEYVFYSSGSGDTYGHLYNESLQELAKNDDGAGNGQFKISYVLTKGETYYWGTRWYSSSNTGNIPVNLKLGAHSYSMDADGKLVCVVCGSEVPKSGTCGDGLNWSFDAATGTLSITGTGEMADYTSSNKAPWAEYANLIKNVNIAESVTSVGNCAFSGCTSLTGINIPSSVTSIGSSAFSGCTSLKSADLTGTGVTTIGTYAFQNCTALKTATFPGTLTSIGDYAFDGCKSLTSADLAGTGVTAIGTYAFQNCTALETATFPDTLTSIGSYAFYNCSALQNPTFPATLSTLGNDAFQACKSITNVDLSKTNVTVLEAGVFNSCSALETVTFHPQTTKLDSWVFNACTSLKNPTFPSTLETLGYKNFNCCTSITEIDLSNTKVTSIGEIAFEGCSALKTVKLPETVEKIDAGAFKSCSSLTEVTIPNSVTTIGSSAFSGCSALKTVALPTNEKFTKIEGSTFYNCTSLTGISIPESVTSINGQAFAYCTRLSSFSVPKTITFVGDNVLRGCSALTELELDAQNITTFSTDQNAVNYYFHVTVADTVDTLSANAMTALSKMGASSISFKGPNYLTVDSWQGDFLTERQQGLSAGEYYVDAQGVLYRLDSDKNTASVAYCPAGISNYQVLASLPADDGDTTAIPVTGVDTLAFADAADLTTLTFASPSTITTLADQAFAGATNLASINGATSADAVLATFTATDRQVGLLLFSQTQITNTDENITDDKLEINKNSIELKIITDKSSKMDPAQGEDGTYRYYTGELATTNISINLPSTSIEEGTTIRVYYRFDSSDAKFDTYKLETPFEIVSSAIGQKFPAVLRKSSAPNCYYLEISLPYAGDTLYLPLKIAYPSPTSRGGNALVWGDILTADESEALGNGLCPMGNYQRLNWSTVPDTFPVTKKEITADSSYLVGDGKGGAYIKDLNFNITMTRSGTSQDDEGKDHMSYVEYEDVLTIPEGVTLADDVLQSIKDGNVKISCGSCYCYFKTKSGREFLYLTRSISYETMENASVSLTDENKLVVRWRIRNTNKNYEITYSGNTYSGNTLNLSCNVRENVLYVAEPKADDTYTFNNSVTTTQHFMYSENQVQSAECIATVKQAEAKLQMSKSRNGSFDDGGVPHSYTLTASNSGALAYEDLAFIEDSLPDILYMHPADIESTFQEDTAHKLEVTITNAKFYTTQDGQTVSGIDGLTGTTDRQNSGSGTEYHGMSSSETETYTTGTIEISWGTDNALQIKVTDAKDSVKTCQSAVNESAIEKALHDLGFVVSAGTRYKVSWDVRDEVLPGGGKIERKVYCTFKDSFMRWNSDTMRAQTGYNGRVSNTVSGVSVDDTETKKQIASNWIHVYYYWEFALSGSCSIDGETVDADRAVLPGDVLDYNLKVVHLRDGHPYDALPLVDHLSGVQALMAPVALNSSLVGKGLETVTDNGTEYYILNTAGNASAEYENVWLSDGQLADTVTVTKGTDSGLDTLIRWYFVDYTGDRTDNVSYRTVVCPDEGELAYSLSNEAWLNDRQTNRLYYKALDWTGMSGSVDKVIVDSVDDDGDGYRKSFVGEGQTVVYRLSITSPKNKDGSYRNTVVTGDGIKDVLPLSIGDYRWSKGESDEEGNVTTEANVKVTYGGGCTVTNKDNWSVDVPSSGNQQYLTWGDDFSISFAGTANIYVELTFPSDAAWKKYCNAYGASGVTNTLNVYSTESSVSHELSITGSARLQKGVVSNGYYNIVNSGYNRYYYPSMNFENTRLYYHNDDAVQRAVEYYVALYNAGPTKLYLTDMQDLLPDGFTYIGTVYASNYAAGDSYRIDKQRNTYNYYVNKENGSGASNKYVTITSATSTTGSGQEMVTFRFDKYSSGSSYNISYDEERGMCYLNPGEKISFTYICATNEEADTENTATNTVTMPYYNFNGGGVVVDDGCKIGTSTELYTSNDGDCELLTNGQVENLGFAGEKSDTQWLASDVTVSRGGEIKPGIAKTLTSKTGLTGITTNNPSYAHPNNTLTWTVTTRNDGTDPIKDYVLTDKMESPYMFIGNDEYVSKVTYNIYEKYENIKGQGSSSNIAQSYQYYYQASRYDLFTIIEGNTDDELIVTTNQGKAETVTIGGEPVTLACSWRYNGQRTLKTVNVELSIEKDDDGNAIMSLHFQDEAMAIPEGGWSVMTLSTTRTDNVVVNTQYINNCFVTPLKQTWDNTTNSGTLTTLTTPYNTEAMSSVRNSAPVITTYGYATSAAKSVTELGSDGSETQNTADCAGTGENYIVLSSDASIFRYTLTVVNSSIDTQVATKAITDFVIIDGLPETGDHSAFHTDDPRYSEFKVSLAENPNVTVTVTAADGTSTTLDTKLYTIGYSTKKDFDSDDWSGTSVWSTDKTGARAIRLIINDSDGETIPAGSTVKLSFDCKVDDTVLPGQVAWNSYGYCYKIKDNPQALKSAPLKVGVKIPAIPKLCKQIVDHRSQACAVEEDTTFNFLVYQGAALSGTYATRDELVAALGEKPYKEYAVTVKAGESLSDAVSMVTDKWTWTNNQKYTIVELPCAERYAFKRFNSSTTNAYTLTYDNAQTQLVTCENTDLRWSIDLTKENTGHDTLSDAVFALYSPNSKDKIAVPAEYTEYGELIASEVTYSDVTWYLKAVGTTDDKGKLTWENLLEKQYYLREIKAPPGYSIDSAAGQIIKQEKESQGVNSVTVVNRFVSYELPESGGVGTLPYIAGGLLLLVGSGSLLLHHLVKRKRGDGKSV